MTSTVSPLLLRQAWILRSDGEFMVGDVYLAEQRIAAVGTAIALPAGAVLTEMDAADYRA